MAELNFGLLTPPGSESIGNAFVRGQDQALAARQAENQNALAQYTLGKAKREDELTNQLLGDLRNATTNEEVYKAYQRAGKGDVASKLRGENLTQEKTRGEIAAQGPARDKAKTELIDARLRQSRGFLDTIDPTDPNAPQQFIAWQEANHKDSVLGPELASRGITAEQSRAQTERAIAAGPAAFADLINRSKLGTEKFMEMNKPTLTTQNLGNSTRIVATPGLGGSATEVPGSAATVTARPTVSSVASAIAARDAAIAAGAPPADIAALNAEVNKALTVQTQGAERLRQGDVGLSINRARLGLQAATSDQFGMTGAGAMYPMTPVGTNRLSNPTPNVNSAAPVIAKPPTSEKPIGGGMSLKDGVAAGLTGDALLATMPKGTAALVTGITDHRTPPPLATTPRGAQLMQLVQLVDPTYDGTQFKTRQGIETAFTSGRLGNNLRSLNVVQDHLGVFNDTAKALGNNNLQFTNVMGNKIAQWTGKPAPTDFGAVRNIVADELTKAILGSPGALGDREEMRKEVNAQNSPAQLAGVINKWQKLIAGQVDGLKNQYTSGGGANPEVMKLFGTAATSAAAGAGAGGAPVKITGDADYNNLPSGAVFIGPDGVKRSKP